MTMAHLSGAPVNAMILRQERWGEELQPPSFGLHLELSELSFSGINTEYGVNGGAIQAYGLSSLSLLHVSFRDNVGALGGALFINHTSSISLEDVHFSTNRAVAGAGVYIEGTISLSIRNSTFDRGVARTTGGALLVVDGLPARSRWPKSRLNQVRSKPSPRMERNWNEDRFQDSGTAFGQHCADLLHTTGTTAAASYSRGHWYLEYGGCPCISNLPGKDRSSPDDGYQCPCRRDHGEDPLHTGWTRRAESDALQHSGSALQGESRSSAR